MVVEALHCEPSQSERAALQQLCGERAVTPLVADRPLWQFHLITRFEIGCAIIRCTHQGIGDGTALRCAG